MKFAELGAENELDAEDCSIEIGWDCNLAVSGIFAGKLGLFYNRSLPWLSLATGMALAENLFQPRVYGQENRFDHRRQSRHWTRDGQTVGKAWDHGDSRSATAQTG